MKTQQRLETPQALQLLNLLLPTMCLLFCNFAWVSFVHVVSYGRFYDGYCVRRKFKKKTWEGLFKQILSFGLKKKTE